MNRRRRSPHPVVLVVGTIAVLALGMLIGGHPSWLPSPLRSVFVSQQDMLEGQALDILTRDYYRPLNRATLIDRGLAGAVASLNDPFSHYFSASDYRAFLNEPTPHLSGVGIDVNLDRRGLRIVDVFDGTPAARAGLQPGELIVQVDGTPLAGRSSTFGSRLIKGRAGTKVRLTVVSGRARRTVTITRAKIVVPVASSSVVTVRGVKLGIVRLTTFTDGSGARVRAQVEQALHRGARALVLDLRFNGGGLLEEAVNVASIFIPDGTIVSTEGRSQPRQVYVAKGGAISPRIPMVVLVNQGTASSAEIVTGALKDRGRAKVVGTRTYGKGVFQELQTLPNGGALDIVTGRWFEPSGHNVGGPGVTEGKGIQPDIRASSNPRGRGDTALTVAEDTVVGELR